MWGRGAGADSCFPLTHSPLPRCRRRVGLPGGTPSLVLLPNPPLLPGAGGRCWGGRAPPPDGASRTLPHSWRAAAPPGGCPGSAGAGRHCRASSRPPPPSSWAPSASPGLWLRPSSQVRGCGAHLPPGPAVGRGGCLAFHQSAGRADSWRCNRVVWGR